MYTLFLCYERIFSSSRSSSYPFLSLSISHFPFPILNPKLYTKEQTIVINLQPTSTLLYSTHLHTSPHPHPISIDPSIHPSIQFSSLTSINSQIQTPTLITLQISTLTLTLQLDFTTQNPKNFSINRIESKRINHHASHSPPLTDRFSNPVTPSPKSQVSYIPMSLFNYFLLFYPAIVHLSISSLPPLFSHHPLSPFLSLHAPTPLSERDTKMEMKMGKGKGRKSS